MGHERVKIRARRQYARRVGHHFHENEAQVMRAHVRRKTAGYSALHHSLCAAFPVWVSTDVQSSTGARQLLLRRPPPIGDVLKVLHAVTDDYGGDGQDSRRPQPAAKMTPAQQVFAGTVFLTMQIKKGPCNRPQLLPNVLKGNQRKPIAIALNVVRAGQ